MPTEAYASTFPFGSNGGVDRHDGPFDDRAPLADFPGITRGRGNRLGGGRRRLYARLARQPRFGARRKSNRVLAGVPLRGFYGDARRARRRSTQQRHRTRDDKPRYAVSECDPHSDFPTAIPGGAYRLTEVTVPEESRSCSLIQVKPPQRPEPRDDWRGQVLAASDGGVDVAFDPVGGDRFHQTLRCMASQGRLVVGGFAEGSIPEVAVNRLLLRNVDVCGVSRRRRGRFERPGSGLHTS